jgi:hypothetical protein
MFKKLTAIASVTLMLGAATPAFAHGWGWHRGPGPFFPLAVAGAVAATAVGVAIATAPPAVVYAPPPAYYPPPGYYAAPPAYYAPTPPPYNQ